jgi:hypothetical protein
MSENNNNNHLICGLFNPLCWLNFLLRVKDEERDPVRIIFWWEVRRILYNALVGIMGIICWITLIYLTPHRPVIEQVDVIAFACLCNFGYTLGWLTELVFYFIAKTKGGYFQHLAPQRTYAPVCFKLGLWFTLFWMLLPVLLEIVFELGIYFGLLPIENSMH